MANPEHLEIFGLGSNLWNVWREENPGVQPDLSNAYFESVYYTLANLAGANLSGADLAGAILEEANLEGANLSGADLAGAILEEANLEGANLSGADLAEANLKGANLKGANLKGANLYRANLRRANLSGANLKRADLYSADLYCANLRRANLSGVDLKGANLGGADFSEAVLERVNFDDADLDNKTQLNEKWRLVWQIVSFGVAGRNLSKADLSGACFRETDFSGTNLAGANLSGADLSGANLRGANLRNADLRLSYLKDAKFDNKTQLNEKWRLVWQIVSFGVAGRNLSKADLSGACFRETDFSGTNLAGANLSGADLEGADLRGTDLSGANLHRANLSRSFLLRANLTNANLEEADLREAMLVGSEGYAANLTRAILTGTRLTQQGEGNVGAGFLELAATRGLATVDFGDDAFLSAYLSESFNYVHQPDIAEAREFPQLIELVLQNIKLIQAMMADLDDPPSVLVEVVQTISAELIKYLKTHPKELYQLKPRQFEELIGEILAAYGWDVRLTPASKDGGYDLFAVTKDISGVTTSWIIECKKYREDRPVGVDIVRGLFGVKLDLKVANAMLATTSHFTKGVHDYKASRYDLELRDYEDILEWINEYRPNPDGKLYIKDNHLMLPGKE